MKVTPPKPCSSRESAEYRVLGPRGTRVAAGEALRQTHELCDVIGKRGWRCSRARTLIQLPARFDPRRPTQRPVQRDPFHERALAERGRRLDRLLAKRHAGAVDEVTHHLRRRHASPSSCGVGAEAHESPQNRGLVTRVRERLHGDAASASPSPAVQTIAGLDHRPSSRWPPASRKASSARWRPADAWATSASNAGVPRSGSNWRLPTSVGHA